MPPVASLELDAPLRFWSGFFGLTARELLTPGLYVMPHVGLADYHGAWVFEYGEARVVSVPEWMLEELRASSAILVDRPAHDPQVLQSLFGERIQRVIGPAYHGYLAPGAFRPYAATGVRILTSDDDAAITRLREACSETAWSHAGIEPERETPRFGVWLEGCLASIAQNEVLAPGAVSPGVVTHPYFRGRGCGKAAVSAVAADALARGELVLYQTLLSNAPAMAVAAALGFQAFGTHVAIRFREG